ncbi:MAG: peptidoglycan DD-metalloendopeptidase family protein [Pseudomonadota bacterium]
MMSIYLLSKALRAVRVLFGASVLCALSVIGSGTEKAKAADTLTISGDPVQGALLYGQTTPGSRVRVNDIPVKVTDDGSFLVGIHRDETGTITVAATDGAGSMETQTISIREREYDIQRINGLPSKMVTPSDAALKRIRADQAAIKKVRKINRPEADFRSGFIWPVKGTITGIFGSQRVLNGQPRQPHYGIDIAAPTGTPVVSPADGVVVMAHPGMYFSGLTMVIDHGHGLQSAMLHLHTMDVKEGDVVRQGQRIGTLGATGRATGPHLDWRVNLGGKRVDAAFLVPPMPKN